MLTIPYHFQSVVLGRGSLACPVDIQISARKNGKEILSRNHARIDCKKGNYYLVDLQSMNGVFVNNRRIKEKKLSHNDIIQFGGCYSEAIKVGAVLTAADSDICVKYQYKSDDSTNCSNSYSKSKYSNSKNGLRDSNSRNELDISIKKRKAIATESYNSAKKNSRNSSNGGTGNSSANKEIVSKSNEGIDAKVILEELQSLKEMYKKLVDNRESHDGATSSCVAKDIDAVSYEKKDVAIGSADPISATISTEKVVILEKQIEELKAYNQSLQAELNRNSSITVDKDSNCTVQIANIKATHNTNNDANKQHSESEQKSASFSSSNSKSLTCDIDFSAVKSSLQCTLCSSLLIDAVVLSCSHGYCRACLELHLQKRISKCPICNDLLPIGERSSTITVNNSNSVVALQTGIHCYHSILV